MQSLNASHLKQCAVCVLPKRAIVTQNKTVLITLLFLLIQRHAVCKYCTFIGFSLKNNSSCRHGEDILTKHLHIYISLYINLYRLHSPATSLALLCLYQVGPLLLSELP